MLGEITITEFDEDRALFLATERHFRESERNTELDFVEVCEKRFCDNYDEGCENHCTCWVKVELCRLDKDKEYQETMRKFHQRERSRISRMLRREYRPSNPNQNYIKFPSSETVRMIARIKL
jgi:hypothetical protein